MVVCPINCPNCECDDSNLIDLRTEFTKDGFDIIEIGKFKCIYCNHEFEIENEGLDTWNNNQNFDDNNEPRECYDPDYASEQYRKMIEGEM